MIDNGKQRILIVEDDAIIAESIHMHLTALGHAPYQPVSNEAEAKKLLAEHEVDMAFLDIRLEEGDNGVVLARHIDAHFEFPYVFLTAYTDDRTLAEVGDVHPSGFIVKPFQKNELKAAIAVASAMKKPEVKAPSISKTPTGSNDHIFVNVGGQWERVEIADILYLKSAHVYTEIHTTEGKKVTRRALSQLVDELEPHGIIRVHRSIAVNLRKVSQFDSHVLRIGEQEFAISASYKHAVKEQMRSL